MDIIIKIIQFFLCFTILVGIHELGHFLMARVFRIRVDKFYIFFDLWFSIFKFKRGDTEYGLGWLPLGGYCKIAGMIDESMDKEQMQQPPKPDEFRTKPAWQRFLVMIAGVVMNVLLAIVIYCGVCYTWGDNYFSNEDAKWGYNFNEAGHKLGFEDGDKFVTIDGEPVDDINKILNSLLITEGERKVVVERGGKHVELTLPLDELIEMRQAKGYEDLFTLRVVLVDEVGQQQQRQNDKENDRCQRVHLRRDGFFRHVVDADRERLEAAALREVADDEVIEREREGHDHAGDDAGQDLRHFHAEKRTYRRAAEIHRGLGQRAVHLLQLRQHLHDDIRQAERDVRREHRPEAETRGHAEQPAEEHEHEHQRNAGDDVRIHHGDVGRRVERGAQIFVAHPVHAHGGSRAHRGRHERCDHGEDERVFERVERFPVAEQLLIPF